VRVVHESQLYKLYVAVQQGHNRGGLHSRHIS
jgi:hypothetical protein